MTKPNFVVLLTDDQTLESLGRMSRVWKSVASRGVFFSNAFACTPICQTARATLLTGQYSHNHGCLGNNTAYTVLDETKLLPYLLEQAGYWTGLVGKYLNQWNTADAVPQGWTDFHGIDPTYYSYNINDNGVVTTRGSGPSDYSTTMIQSKMLSMLAAATEPFFIYGAFNAPHVTSDALSAATPGPDYLGCTPISKTFPHGPDWEIADVSLKPAYVQALPHRWTGYSAQIDANWRAETEALHSVDAAVKAVMDSLIASGKINETYVIFTTDHAFFHGQQRIETGKVAPYDPAIRIPLIIAGPAASVAQNKTCNNLVNHADVTATILDLAGVAPALSQDGFSLKSYLANPAAASLRDYTLVEYFGAADFNAVTNYTCVRSKDWKYTEYTTGEKELYDLRLDPHEVTNVVGVSANAATVAALSALVAQGTNCSGSSCVM